MQKSLLGPLAAVLLGAVSATGALLVVASAQVAAPVVVSVGPAARAGLTAHVCHVGRIAQAARAARVEHGARTAAVGFTPQPAGPQADPAAVVWRAAPHGAVVRAQRLTARRGCPASAAGRS
ncbi:hypothetical protein [Kitasatospora sp. NBC_01266]|uniref:hypothetical protein n=1 Tax=Kitasatospora sp. NBC_01266 TaxID=2903572 RepID=UPI002E36F1AD|nr:hypothetical protein [Kitasatospora sp. NBC_01266]